MHEASMANDPPKLTDAEIKEIAARRAESLKRVQELNQKKSGRDVLGKDGKSPKAAPPKARSFRHQGR
jgi:hypothetical protein